MALLPLRSFYHRLMFINKNLKLLKSEIVLRENYFLSTFKNSSDLQMVRDTGSVWAIGDPSGKGLYDGVQSDLG